MISVIEDVFSLERFQFESLVNLVISKADPITVVIKTTNINTVDDNNISDNKNNGEDID